jgi:hypothetical protein
MKIIHRLIITTITASLLLPITASAAKADRKKAAEPLPAYATIDPDSKGSVSKDQFVAALKEKLGSEDAAKTKFEALDKDSDGKLTKEEYAAGNEPKKRKKKKKDQ